MKKYLIRLLTLVFGLFIFAIGIVMTMQANIGYAPWDVLHKGLSEMLGISFGSISILVGLLILIGVATSGEKLGFGTIANMVLIGAFIDLIVAMKLIPLIHGFFYGVLFMALGLIAIAFGSYFYIKSGFGAGPRDSLMIVLRRKTHLPVGVSRVIVEGTTVLLGWLLGGPVGLGTVISAFGVGISIQFVFSLLKFDPATIEQETVQVTLQKLRLLMRID
ncbi:MAG: hypothetical protein PHC86_06500 [Eubacteriales bacterium]|nr:hypothetical protein [Eubacteriales bacterium]